ncbi:MAG: hypothetical protein QOF73_811, partial [Thermomicrobiales bacterium]|nr:hypothetical protein [Thermomicrobiales bacterium]
MCGPYLTVAAVLQGYGLREINDADVSLKSDHVSEDHPPEAF